MENNQKISQWKTIRNLYKGKQTENFTMENNKKNLTMGNNKKPLHWKTIRKLYNGKQ